jgi:hypothetical protein
LSRWWKGLRKKRWIAVENRRERVRQPFEIDAKAACSLDIDIISGNAPSLFGSAVRYRLIPV